MDKKQPSGHAFLNPEQILKQIGIPVGQRVADFGCGGGYFVLPASKLVGDEGRVFGVDILKTALSSLGSKIRLYGLSNIQLVWANVEKYGVSRGIHDKTVDTVLMVQLLSASTKRNDIFKEADRVIKHDGRLIVIDWKSDKLSFSPNKDLHVSIEEVKELAKAHYYKSDREIDVGQHHFCLVFQK